MNMYQQNGYADRMDYLTNLSFDYGIDLRDVLMLADILGAREDFDGLVVMLEDVALGY